MRFATPVVISLAAVYLLGGCASSSAVRQAKLNDPIIVVTVQSTPKKSTDKPTVAKMDREKAVEERERLVSILGALKGTDPSDIDDGVFGGVVGGVIGGPGGGFGGLGLSGVGSGGGGFGQGIGLGSIGTIGRGSGRGSTYGSGASSSNSSSSNERVKATLGNVTVTGLLTVDVVQRQVDQHRAELKRCYQFEVIHGERRWGTATFQFTIDGRGRVIDVHPYDSTLHMNDAEDCIAHAIGSFEFPPPVGGTSVTVLLPVTF